MVVSGVMSLLAAMIALGVPGGEELDYPFGPFTEAKDVKTAARLRRRLEEPGGLRRAFAQLCHDAGEQDIWEVEDLVSRNFLIERFREAMPILIAAVRRGDAPRSRQAAVDCAGRAFALLEAAACDGYDIGGTGPAFDAHPLAVGRRAAAQRAIVAALDGKGPRAAVALQVIFEMGRRGACSGLHDTVRAATPALLKLLGAPETPVPWLYDLNAPDPPWETALRTLTFGGAPRSLAEQPLAAFLEHDTTAPLAALALAGMGVDLSATVPRLARIVAAAKLDDIAQLGQLRDALEALQAIGKPARPALPALAGITARDNCHSVGDEPHIGAVQAIATPGDAAVAVAILSPFLRCEGNRRRVLRALRTFGGAARAPLLAVLRNAGRSVTERLDAAEGLAAGSLGEQDRGLVALLNAKVKRHEVSPATDWYLLSRGPAVEWPRCREEAGLPALPPTGATYDFAGCLANYLCGPDAQTYARTMERCCRTYERRQLPAFCPAPARPAPERD
jgi:hypothetical protein